MPWGGGATGHVNTVWFVNLAGIGVIAGIVWWFWLSRPRAVRVQSHVVDVRVADGVYTPSRIVARAGSPITIRFIRHDPSPCAEKVTFDELGVSADLPLGAPKEVTLEAIEAGEYTFSCQMQMYRGTLVVS